MAKARDAFRTISEVSEYLDTPAHVLRFWESKFSQVKPVKRAGGRRYYRPDDIDLLAGIKKLLHEQGMTIKGAQKLLREKGVKHVQGLVDHVIPDDAIVVSDPAPETKAAAPAPAENVAPIAAAPIEPRTAATDANADTVRPSALFRDTDRIRANAADILPLLKRLQAVHDRMAAN